MNGPNETRNINRHRSLSALEELRVKATTAKQQGHPLAEKFATQYDKLNAELNGSVH